MSTASHVPPCRVQSCRPICVALQPSDTDPVRVLESMDGPEIAGDDAVDPPLCDVIAQRGMPTEERNFQEALHPQGGAVAKLVLKLRGGVETGYYVVQSVDSPCLD